MNPELQNELTDYYKKQNEEAKLNPVIKFFRLNNVATLVGIVGSVFGLYQFTDKKAELAEVETQLKIKTEALETQKTVIAALNAVANSHQVNISQNQRKIEDQEQSIESMTKDINFAKEQLAETKEELDLTIKEAGNAQRQLQNATLKLQQATAAEKRAIENYQLIIKNLAKTEKEYESYQEKIIAADAKLGNVFKYLDEEQFTEQAICELISINTVVADRKAFFAWYSPVVVTVFVSYPDYYRDKLNTVIENVVYKSDVNLVGNQAPDIQAYDNNGNHWVWQYIGETAPTFITATVTYLHDNQLKNFSIKMTWDANGKASKSTCASA